jgi:hypothetical protein
MKLTSINFEGMQKVEYRSRQVERIVASGSPPPRQVFANAHFFFKIWRPENIDHRIVYWKGTRRLVENRNSNGQEVLLGFLYGLYDENLCPAFVEHIYDGPRLVGYVTKRGKPVSSAEETSPEFENFVRLLFRRSLRSGVVHRDLKPANVIKLTDGRLSLIDLECPLTLLNGYSVKREKKNGSLAKFTSRRYRKLIKKFLDPECKISKIVEARRRIENALPSFFALSVPSETTAQTVRGAGKP